MFYRYLSYLLLWIITLSLVFSGMVYNHSRVQTENLTASLLGQLDYKLGNMASEIEQVRKDLLYLSKDVALTQLAESTDRSSSIKQVYKNVANLISVNNNYSHISFIDTSGQEIFRVNNRRGNPDLVAPENLQNKSHKGYFEKAISLTPGYIYASALELNSENKQLELPIKPVIHFSTPLDNSSGSRIGILVINYLSKQLLQNFKKHDENELVQLMLLNKDAYYLANPNPEYEWAFMFKDDDQYLFSQQFPQAWSQLQRSRDGVIHQENGIFSFASIPLNPALQSIQYCGVCGLSAVAYIPPKALKQIILEEINHLVHIYVLLFILGCILIWYFTRHIRERHETENQIALLNKIVKNERDLFIDGPTIVFNWREQYGWPVDYVSENIESVLGYSATSFMNNDLSYSSIVAPEFFSQIAEDLNRARQQKLKSFELRPYQVVHANGKRVWLRHFSTAIHDQQDNITHYYGYVNDISHLKKTEEELKKSREYVHNLLETLPDPTVVIDVKNYHILLANESAKALYNQSLPIPPGTTCHQFSHHQNKPCDGINDPCPIQQILQQKKSTKVVHRHFVNNGDEVFVEVMSRPIFDEKGEIVQIIESQRDITHHIITERRLTHQATTDPLTKTYNRLKFDHELLLQLEIASRSPHNLGLIMFDLDDFKKINDTYGHDIGDKVLIDVAQLARDSIRKSDILARWGGEEFMILLPETMLHVAQKIADNLRQKILTHNFVVNQQLTASFGVTISNVTDSGSELLKRVDNALYKSKNNGKNCVTTLLSQRD